MKFNSADIAGLLVNEADFVGKSLRTIGDGQRVVISQGYGMADKGLPLRVPAYLVPVLHLLKSLPPSVTAEVYFAKAGVLRANGSDAAAIERNFELLESLMRLYISKVHANLKNRISILWDADPEPCVDKTLDDLAARSVAIVTLRRNGLNGCGPRPNPFAKFAPVWGDSARARALATIAQKIVYIFSLM